MSRCLKNYLVSRINVAVALVVLVAGLILLLGIFRVGAASAAAGITVSPAIANVTLNQYDSETEFEFTLTNHNPETVALRLSSLDFGTNNESGGVSFLGRNATADQKKYGLSEWLKYSADAVVLAPGQVQKIRGLVTNTEAISPGGHYGAIVITPEGDSQATDRVQLVPSSSVLVFLKKSGGERIELKLNNAAASGSLMSFPQSLTLRFQNSGNVHLIPRGIVTIRDTFGSEVSRAIINQDSSIIFPESYRKYPVKLTPGQRLMWPGRYSVSIDYRPDGTTSSAKGELTFYYYGSAIYGLVVLLAVVVVLTLLIRRCLRRSALGIRRSRRTRSKFKRYKVDGKS